MAAEQGLTAEQYRAVVAIVDDRMAEIRAARVDFDRLVEAQARSEARLGRVEEALDRLAEAQVRTEERLDRLAQAQARTEEEIALLVRDQRSVRQQLGRLSGLIGATAEAEAERWLLKLLSEKGYRILGRPAPLSLDGEVDVAVPVADPKGRELWVLLEARARLRGSDVRQWERRLRDRNFRSRLGQEGVAPPFLAYAFGLRVYRDAEEKAREAGIGLLSPAGEVVEPTPTT